MNVSTAGGHEASPVNFDSLPNCVVSLSKYQVIVAKSRDRRQLPISLIWPILALYGINESPKDS